MTPRQLRARLDRVERTRKPVAPATEFAVDPFLAKVLRDDERRLEQLDPYPSPESEEASKLREGIFVLARIIGCPLGYTDNQANRDRDRLDELGRKRRSSRGTLSDTEDAEEAQLTARLWAFDVQPGPDDRGSGRVLDLKFKAFERPLTFAEQRELEFLKGIYPEEPLSSSDDPVVKSLVKCLHAFWENTFKENDERRRRACFSEEDERPGTHERYPSRI